MCRWVHPGWLAAVFLHAGLAHAVPATTTSSDDRAAVVDEIKTDQAAIKSINDEITGDDKDAADAETRAKNPPPTIAERDKTAYIDQQKNQEQMAQDAAGEARERLKEAEKSLEDDEIRLKAMDKI